MRQLASNNFLKRSIRGLPRYQPPQNAAALFWSGICIFLCAIASIWTFDEPLADFMKVHVGGDLATTMRLATELGVAYLYIFLGILGVLLPTVFIGIGVREHVKLRAIIVRQYSLFLLASLALSGLIVNVMKFFFGRIRPRYLFSEGAYGFSPLRFLHGADSFPSGHSQTAFAVAVVLSFISPQHTKKFIAVAILVAISRVVMTNHYLSDVLIGSYIGFAVPFILAPIMLRATQKLPVDKPQKT